MSIKSDRWIRRMAETHGMIEPFEPGQVRENSEGRIVSYGTSSYGYDVRCSDEFKIFTNINSAIVDPKGFDESSFVDIQNDGRDLSANRRNGQFTGQTRMMLPGCGLILPQLYGLIVTAPVSSHNIDIAVITNVADTDQMRAFFR